MKETHGLSFQMAQPVPLEIPTFFPFHDPVIPSGLTVLGVSG